MSVTLRYGRRILLLIAHLLMAVSGTCVAFSNSFTLYCLFRFGCGMALSGLGLNTFSLSTSSFIPNNHSNIGVYWSEYNAILQVRQYTVYTRFFLVPV